MITFLMGEDIFEGFGDITQARKLEIQRKWVLLVTARGLIYMVLTLVEHERPSLCVLQVGRPSAISLSEDYQTKSFSILITYSRVPSSLVSPSKPVDGVRGGGV